MRTTPFRFVSVFVFLAATFVAGAQEAKTADARKLGPFTLTKEMDRSPVLDQCKTGTCWSFGTVSFFESEVKRLRGIDVDLSEIWWARGAVVEKAKRYFESDGKTTFGEGGLSHDLTLLMATYGVAPQSAYTGLLDGNTTHRHDAMFAMMRAAMDALLKAERDAHAAAEAAKGPNTPPTPFKVAPLPALVRALSGIADAYLGAPPATFEFDGKTWDAKSFASDYLKIDPTRYVEVMSYGTSPFGGKAKLDVPDNWLSFDGYENVPLDRFMEVFDGAIAAGMTLAIDVDVSEKGFDAMKGVAVLSDEDEADPKRVTQERRDAMFRNKETTDDHLMHVVGVARHDDGRTFYLAKNSWGAVGPYEGYVFMSAAYMRAKLLAYMVHADALTRP
jgi:bleomycin hydrolase